MIDSDGAWPREASGRPGDAGSGQARRLGRPPRIDRAAIARAAGETPLEELTLRSVADRLGVSVPTLYHYVSGRDELLRLAAEQSALRVTLPVDRGRHWAVWLCEWSAYTRRAFVNDPQLLKQYIDGAIGIEVQAGHLEAAIGPCVRQGFGVREAIEAYDLVCECGLGAAITEIRARRARREGRTRDAELRHLLSRRDEGLELLRALVASGGSSEPPSFGERLRTVLAGIAARRGEAWEPIVEAIDAAGLFPDAGGTDAR